MSIPVAILAGGRGTRLAEITRDRPKALAEIGGQPILRHIMSHYQGHGLDDFVIALGHGSAQMRGYFRGLEPGASDALSGQPRGRVRLVDTGEPTMTGGRIKRLQPHVGGGTFMLTWCDGVSDVHLGRLLEFHRSHGRLATLTAVRPPARFGHLQLDGSRVAAFCEKPEGQEGWINGAFFVLEPEVLDYIGGDDTQWEREPMERLALEGQLMAFRHEGFWRCMDTIHDAELLNRLWQSGEAPWKTWSDNANPVDGTQRLHRHGAHAPAAAART